MKNNYRFKFRVLTMENKIIYNVGIIEFFADGRIIVNEEIPVKKLMQSTGLRDKNGKLIFEYDLLRGGIFEKDYLAFCEKCKSIQIHSCDEEIGCYSCEGDFFFNDFLENVNEIEIIGNRFENPELLPARQAGGKEDK